MNIMNINNTMFGAAKPRVNWARNVNNVEYPVSKELKDRINTIMPALEAEAKNAKTNVTLAQKGDSLLINAGPLTSIVEDVSKKTDEYLDYKIADNIDMNKYIKKRVSLKKFLGWTKA